MDTIVIIQARMGSSRLPGKVLKKFGNEDTLTYVVERCRKIKGADLVIIATSNLPQDDAIAMWCEQRNINCYRGPESDVLQRYVDVANKYKPKYIVRVTADCPFVDYEMASDMIALIKKKQVDIIDIPEELPRGIASEVFSYSMLQRVNEIGKESRHREHVTFYAYEYPEQFKRVNYNVGENRKYPQFRITLDVEEDYKMLSNIAKHFNDSLVSTVNVIEYLKTHDKIAEINAHVEQKPVIIS